MSNPLLRMELLDQRGEPFGLSLSAYHPRGLVQPRVDRCDAILEGRRLEPAPTDVRLLETPQGLLDLPGRSVGAPGHQGRESAPRGRLIFF
eukprot:9498591-Pyramimonas_sp.AAC.1